MSDSGISEHRELVEADGAFEVARSAMTVIAACATLDSFAKTPKGATMAADILADKNAAAGLPDILRTRLKALARGS